MTNNQSSGRYSTIRSEIVTNIFVTNIGYQHRISPKTAFEVGDRISILMNFLKVCVIDVSDGCLRSFVICWWPLFTLKSLVNVTNIFKLQPQTCHQYHCDRSCWDIKPLSPRMLATKNSQIKIATNFSPTSVTINDVVTETIHFGRKIERRLCWGSFGAFSRRLELEFNATGDPEFQYWRSGSFSYEYLPCHWVK